MDTDAVFHVAGCLPVWTAQKYTRVQKPQQKPRQRAKTGENSAVFVSELSG